MQKSYYILGTVQVGLREAHGQRISTGRARLKFQRARAGREKLHLDSNTLGQSKLRIDQLATIAPKRMIVRRNVSFRAVDAR